MIDPHPNPLQVTYRGNTSVDDIENMALHFILQYLDWILAIPLTQLSLLHDKLTSITDWRNTSLIPAQNNPN